MPDPITVGTFAAAALSEAAKATVEGIVGESQSRAPMPCSGPKFHIGRAVTSWP